MFCIEYHNMEKNWEREVTQRSILKKLLQYKKKWYNHVTFLWGEPLIHPVLLFATTTAQKLWYTTLVTTNSSLLQFDIQAQKQLPSIDQLLISIPIIDTKKQLEINQTKWIINFETVFTNIHKYWKWNFLKINTVLTPMNLDQIKGIIEFVWNRWAHEISLTYPDIKRWYYSDEHIISKIAPKYKEVAERVPQWIDISEKLWLSIKIVDLPFCVLPDLSYIQYTDDVIYDKRLKVYANEDVFIHWEDIHPRARRVIEKCKKCAYNDTCWWPSRFYGDVHNFDEISPISKKLK